MTEPIIGELVPASHVAMGSLRGNDANEIVQSASALATTLRDIINDRGLYKEIQGRNFVLAEGWTTLAAMCGMVAREVACENVGDGVYVACVALVRVSDGVEISRASAECGGDGDEIWQKRAAYTRRSMAITRATGKVCRIALSWIMNLAGFQPTPAEEMEQVEREIAQRKPAPEKPEPAPATIGEDKVKSIWKMAAVRVKELVERGDLSPGTKPDIIMRSLLAAWNLEHTKDIPRKLFGAFENLVNRWVPDQPVSEMQPTAADMAF